MKKSILIVALLMITCLSYAKFQTPAYQHRLVNDYIGLLSSSDKEQLENNLREFEKKSSIEIAIAILDDLDGMEASDVATQIGQDWGVGKKEFDNGIVFLVVKYKQSALEKIFSSRSGDVFVATGYGLEPYLTDVTTGRLLDKYFIPYVKKGEYTQAIQETITGIISELGDDAWQQREELRLQREIERKATLKAFGAVLASLIGLVALACIVIALCKWVSRKWEAYQKGKQLKKEFKDAFNHWNELQKEFCTQCKKTEEWNLKLYPVWAKNQYNEAKTGMTKIAERGVDLNEGFPKRIKKNLDLAETDLNELKAINQKLPTWESTVKKIEGEIQRYKDEAPKKVEQAEQDLQGFKAEYEKQQKVGFNLQFFPGMQAGFEKTLKGIQDLKGLNQEKEVFDNSSELIKAIHGKLTSLSEWVALPKSNQQHLEEIKSFQEKLPILKETAMKTLQELKQHPKDNWGEVENNLLRLTTLEGYLSNIIQQAEQENSMEKQHFTEAKEHLGDASQRISTIQEYCYAPGKKLKEIAEKKTGVENLLKSIPSEIEKVKSKIQSGGNDIESSTKRIFADAESKFQQGKQLAGSNPVNWITLFILLTSAIQLTHKAYQSAINDIDEAEREKARKRRNSYSSSSSNYSSSHHSGGFSTGGGSFGGGGAGRSW
ncbi:MAG: TPM domain-containing protein [Candidatus Peribacteria bacterium]|jgi:uncharacterized membrane protein YgcG|nr:TPM domain-containing protein [Candidatus Peribacteria bacterium]